VSIRTGLPVNLGTPRRGLSVWYTGTSAAAFSPADVTGLKVWLKADAITGKVNADPISQWDDSSGTGNHVVQATGGNQPTYRTNVVNSLPVVRFDGSDDFLEVAALAAAIPVPYVVFCVGKISTDKDFNRFYGESGGSANLGLDADNTGQVYIYNGSVSQIAASNGAAFHIYTVKWNGASSTAGVDTATLGAENPGTTDSQLDGLRVGMNGGGTPLAGDIAEILVYDNVISAGNTTNVVAYLGTKYGITVS
jgi:hypothetical protein